MLSAGTGRQDASGPVVTRDKRWRAYGRPWQLPSLVVYIGGRLLYEKIIRREESRWCEKRPRQADRVARPSFDAEDLRLAIHPGIGTLEVKRCALLLRLLSYTSSSGGQKHQSGQKINIVEPLIKVNTTVGKFSYIASASLSLIRRGPLKKSTVDNSLDLSKWKI